MTAFDAACRGHSLARTRRDEYKAEERQQREPVIAEFDAGDTDATLQALAAEVLRNRHVGHVRFHCLRTLMSLWIGQSWANVESRRAHLFYYFVDERLPKVGGSSMR